jgi:hypothetical protein
MYFSNLNLLVKTKKKKIKLPLKKKNLYVAQMDDVDINLVTFH